MAEGLRNSSGTGNRNPDGVGARKGTACKCCEGGEPCPFFYAAVICIDQSIPCKPVKVIYICGDLTCGAEPVQDGDVLIGPWKGCYKVTTKKKYVGPIKTCLRHLGISISSSPMRESTGFGRR